MSIRLGNIKWHWRWVGARWEHTFDPNEGPAVADFMLKAALSGPRQRDRRPGESESVSVGAPALTERSCVIYYDIGCFN
jgi:hypothetical protein